MSQNERSLQSMKGLLNFCLKSTEVEDSPKDAVSMDPQRQEWLREALSSLSRNPVKEMLELLKVVTTETGENQKTALVELHEYCEDIDLAVDFHKIGGFEIFPGILEHQSPEIREHAAHLVMALVQNNPYCQQAALDLTKPLLLMLDSDQSPKVKIKALGALSCLTRDFISGQQAFLEADGLAVLLRALRGTDERVIHKGAFMLHTLLDTQSQIIDELLKIPSAVEQLIGMLRESDGELLASGTLYEHVTGSLLVLANTERGLAECRQNPELKQLLQHKIESWKLSDEFMEALDYCRQLAKRCFDEDW